MLVVAAVFWIATVVRAWRWYGTPGSPSLRAVTIALLAIAVGLTLDLPQVNAVIGERMGQVGPGDLAKQIAIVVGAWACQSLLLHLTRGAEATARSERKRATAAVVVAVMTSTLYLIPSLRDGQLTGGLIGPFVTEARLTVVTYAGTVLFQVMLLCWGHAERGSHLGRGVRMMGLGCMSMVIYALCRIAYFVSAEYFGNAHPALYRAGDVLQGIGLAAIALGTLIPVLGRLAENLRRRRAYAALGPLWSFLTERVPDVVFAGSPGRDADTWRLDRRVVEIQDSLVVLTPTLPMVAGEAPPAERLARALLASAARTSMVTVTGSATAPPAPAQELIAAPAAMNTVDWLIAVSRALARAQSAQGVKQ